MNQKRRRSETERNGKIGGSTTHRGRRGIPLARSLTHQNVADRLKHIDKKTFQCEIYPVLRFASVCRDQTNIFSPSSIAPLKFRWQFTINLVGKLNCETGQESQWKSFSLTCHRRSERWDQCGFLWNFWKLSPGDDSRRKSDHIRNRLRNTEKIAEQEEFQCLENLRWDHRRRAQSFYLWKNVESNTHTRVEEYEVAKEKSKKTQLAELTPEKPFSIPWSRKSLLSSFPPDNLLATISLTPRNTSQKKTQKTV